MILPRSLEDPMCAEEIQPLISSLDVVRSGFQLKTFDSQTSRVQCDKVTWEAAHAEQMYQRVGQAPRAAARRSCAAATASAAEARRRRHLHLGPRHSSANKQGGYAQLVAANN